jgi:hypothetical protein
MLNPWVSLGRDQLIPVNKVVNVKEQLEKGLEEEESWIEINQQQNSLLKGNPSGRQRAYVQQ